jgi:hypothetical protein
MEPTDESFLSPFARHLLQLLGISLFLAACGLATPLDRNAPPDDITEQSGAVSSPTRRSTEARQLSPNVTVEPEGEVNPPTGAEREFRTDFSRHTVNYTEILSGGVPKDGIPAIDQPQFETVAQADDWLQPMEPVIRFALGDDTRAYPLQILIWHEIVNDVVEDQPVLITFCPLCNTAIAFERTVNENVLDFGTTGRLRFSNLVMYDRQTETWWQQASGEAIAGKLTGTQLNFLPATIIAWQDFKEAHPQGSVLSRETGYSRSYGQNPYVGYDDVRRSPFLYRGPVTPDQLPPMARVLAVELGGEAVAFPYETLESLGVVNTQIGGHDIVVMWTPGTASALDTSDLAFGRDVGAAAAFFREADEKTLTFSTDGSSIQDEETGSHWNLDGQATDGELVNAQLKEIVAVNHFWFSWVAFNPETRIYQP